MNIFIVCTGRTGSKTFSKACSHFSNFTSAHESRLSMISEEKLKYPNNHIECDNRLSWMLGSLFKKYGNDAFYVHLKRDKLKVAKSYNNRWHVKNGIIRAFSRGVLMNPYSKDDFDVCCDYVDVVNNNIEGFFEDKENFMTINMENIADDFDRFIEKVGAEGDLDSARKSWETVLNPTRLEGKRYRRLKYYISKKMEVFEGRLKKN